jgi:YjbE family integral membrane protein
MLEFVHDPQNWAALAQIMFINMLLSGDNAVVIALACRSLQPQQRRLGVLFGTLGAIVLRIVLTIIVLSVLKSEIPYVQLIGAAFLLWIGVKLIVPDRSDGAAVSAKDNLIAAVKTIVIADFVMSLDNVLGVAAAANGSVPLIVIGLVISIPIIVLGSTLIMTLMDRFPVIITVGGALLGYVAGEMAVGDPAIKEHVEQNLHYLHYGVPISCAVLVVAAGKWLAKKQEAKVTLVDLAVPEAGADGSRERGY